MKIHFIGIGGIGVSALARYYLEKGHLITGSDLDDSEITKELMKLGIKIFIGQKKENIHKDLDLIIYSPAVKKDNPEFKQAKKLKIKEILSYPQALGKLTKEHFTIAVSGTHGKSTTTCMLGLLLIKAGFDPTVIVGTKFKEFNDSNFRMGKSKYLVIESCEHKESFLNYRPDIIVLTNIEEDHLDYYKNLNNILKAFKKHISYLPKQGFLIINKDDKNSINLKSKVKIRKYSLKQKEAKKIKQILKVPGQHNISNALAALEVARVLKIPDKVSFKALSEYKGSWRRFQIIRNNPKIISDYGHHPTEIKATLEAVKEKWPNKTIWIVFQPHQHQRTYYLFDQFVESFNNANKVVLTDIFGVAGREDKRISKKADSKNLAKEIQKKGIETYFIKDFMKIPGFLKKKVKKNDIVLIMGAGDIYKIVDMF